MYITNLVDNAIHQINTRTGASRTVLSSELSVPGGLDAVTENGVDQIYVGDLFAFRKIDGETGTVTDLKRALHDHIELPMSVTIQGDRMITSSWFTDAVEVFDRRTNKSVAVYRGFLDPVDALFLDGGNVLVAEQGSGRLLAFEEVSYTTVRRKSR